jgi:hypothetical protein
MYQAKTRFGVNHPKGKPVTPDYYEGIEQLVLEEGKKQNPNLDFHANWVLGGDNPYIQIHLEGYFYGDTLFVDPEEFFNGILNSVRELSGKDMWLIGEIETDIPDAETRKCPTCLGTGRVYVSDGVLNKRTTKECVKRVRLDLLKDAPPHSEPKFFCRSKFCTTEGKKTEVPEGVTRCDNCLELHKQLDHQQKVRNDTWMDSIVKTELQKMSNKIMNQDNLNHQRLLKEYREKLANQTKS